MTRDQMRTVLFGPEAEAHDAVREWLRDIGVKAGNEPEHVARHPDYVGGCNLCAWRAHGRIRARAERERRERNAR